MLNTFFLLLIVGMFLYPRQLSSAPPTSVKDTLSNSQLSYFARLSTGVSAGDSIIRIGTSAPTLSTNNLFVGDTVAIGTTATNGALNKYTILDIADTQSFEINTGVGQSSAFFGAAVIATRSAVHTVSFTPQSNATSGFWQFLIRATTRTGEDFDDGIPDQQGFDFGQDVGSTTTGLGTRLKAADVVCPNFGAGTTAFSVGTTAVVGSNSYHVIICALGTGNTNAVGVGYSASIGRALTTGSQLINPSAATSHTEGTADIYNFYVRHLDSAQTVIDADTRQARIAVVEAVRVTATVDPTLTFIIDSTNVGVGATICGNTLGSAAANTTATAVSYGSISLGQFNDLAQRLSCVTNAPGGYVVTVYEDNSMHSITTGTTIPDTTCPSNSCTTTSPALWSTNSASGWGYSIQNVNVGTSIFHYTAGYRPFGVGTANAQEIMKNTAVPTATENAYVCYRLTASTTQEAGNYENELVYTATATF